VLLAKKLLDPTEAWSLAALATAALTPPPQFVMMPPTPNASIAMVLRQDPNTQEEVHLSEQLAYSRRKIIDGFNVIVAKFSYQEPNKYGSFFDRIYTRGCHWFPRLLT
jgi:hypothetical protein